MNKTILQHVRKYWILFLFGLFDSFVKHCKTNFLTLVIFVLRFCLLTFTCRTRTRTTWVKFPTIIFIALCGNFRLWWKVAIFRAKLLLSPNFLVWISLFNWVKSQHKQSWKFVLYFLSETNLLTTNNNKLLFGTKWASWNATVVHIILNNRVHPKVTVKTKFPDRFEAAKTNWTV